jgi:hypothetical protein
MNNERAAYRNDTSARATVPVSRRDVVAAAGSVAAAASVLADPVARTAHAAGSDRLKVGLVGCGGRGTGAASQAISADTGVVLWAVADAFADQVKAGANLSRDRPCECTVPSRRAVMFLARLCPIF